MRKFKNALKQTNREPLAELRHILRLIKKLEAKATTVGFSKYGKEKTIAMRRLAKKYDSLDRRAQHLILRLVLNPRGVAWA